MNPAPTELESEARRTQTQARLSWLARIAGILFAVLYFTVRNFIRDETHPSALRIAVGLLLAIITAYFFWKTERDLLANNDELEQKIRVEAMAMTLPLALATVLLLGMLADGGIILLTPGYYWLPILYIYLVALAWSRRRYR